MNEPSFSQQLLTAARPIWAAMARHPFVQEVAGGQLDSRRFDFWVQQDHYFVLETRRLWAATAARAPEEEITRALLQAAEALDPELQLFRDHAQARGIPLEVEPAPICLGYISFALQIAGFGDFLDLFTVIYGAEKAYFDTWSAVKGQTPPDSPYSRWIANWTSPAFGAFVDWLEQTLDRLAAGQPEAALARARQVFLTSARFEYLFWDMAYRQESWPL